MKLLICIPTYNRYDSLKRTLDQLTKCKLQSKIEINIVVIDNCSDDMRYLSINNDYPIEYIRNDENIGLYRNILKCFVVAKGCKFDWFWCISDDDRMTLNGLDYLSGCTADLLVVRNNISSPYINFEDIINFATFSKHVPLLSGIGLISACIYKKDLFDLMLKSIEKDDFKLEWTLFPHLYHLYGLIEARSAMKISIYPSELFIFWNQGEASYSNQHANAIVGSLYFANIYPNLKIDILSNFVQFYSYTHFFRCLFFNLKLFIKVFQCLPAKYLVKCIVRGGMEALRVGYSKF